ncbi:uncharacterized protein Z520_03193 [Fonsecaea multimorphosa CBS 102226]|uniref:Uncharacterized protein n=1 Tax=Fonsecaea multimorphosa CBS 102226 TaxID=1442371 RepID=A0A0D2HI92_9EURO|nr:uncharacterized protein Z520_03193 [Fonsecaea multimorphosa CBS 102226]KIY01641.1 hypothetical protein Z520_03193 [Fonsecaea multimorphosa CBS 102226]OAL23114.1 hypothetical protein AYO22_06607 [Fonsecaea multimorphosa]
MSPSSNTIVLITGANQGIGFECVKKLAAEQPGYRIILCSRDAQRGKQAASAVTNFANDTTVEALELDVNSDESIARAVKYVEEKYGRLDVLFNNAGIMSTPGAKSLREDLRGVMETNAISAACVTEAFIPLMKNSPHPRIVFMSSTFGSITYCLDSSRPFYGYDAKPYFTSKAALNMLGAQYAVQLGKQGFKVNMVDPEFRSTNLNGFHEYGGDPAEGALEACRLIVSTDPNGPNGAFTSLKGPLPW